MLHVANMLGLHDALQAPSVTHHTVRMCDPRSPEIQTAAPRSGLEECFDSNFIYVIWAVGE